jgi:signal transduction histidine kinase
VLCGQKVSPPLRLRLSAGLAHELNNPAAAVQRGAEYLRDTIIRLESMMMIAA